MAIQPQVATRLRGWKVCPARCTGLSTSSLIVPTYRRASEIRNLLETLLRHENAWEGSVPAEIVIVDGSPDDDVENAVRKVVDGGELPFCLRYVRSPRGLTRQRNVGLDSSSGQFVFFLDDDAVPAIDYFRVVLSVFLNDTCGKIGAVGGCVINEWNRPLDWRWRARLALGLAPRIEPMRYAHCGTSNPRALLKPYSGVKEVDILSGCAFSFRRQVFEHDRFSLFFDGYSQGEDMEMSLRVGRRWNVVCAGDAHVTHSQSIAGRPFSFEKGRMEIRNRLFIWRRYSSGQANVIDRLRLGGDFVFLAVLDLCTFVSRPWRLAPFRHCSGIVWALLESALNPPKYDESASRVTYEVEFKATHHVDGNH